MVYSLAAMNAQQEPLARLHALKQLLEDYEKAGTQTVPTTAVLHQVRDTLAQLLPSFQTPKEALIEKYKTELKVWEAGKQHQLNWSLENFRQTIALAQTATKYIILIHGGAAVALLGFLARVWQPGVGDAVRPFANSLRWFAIGLFIAAFAALLSYVIQLLYGATGKWRQRLAVGLHLFAFALALTTFATLGQGIATAYNGFVSEESSLELRQSEEQRAPGDERREEERAAAATGGSTDTGPAATPDRPDEDRAATGTSD